MNYLGCPETLFMLIYIIESTFYKHMRLCNELWLCFFFFYYFLIIAVFMVLVLNRLCIIVSFAEQLLCFLSQIENGTLNGFYGCTTPKRRRRVEPMHFFVSNTTPHVSNFIFLRDGGREEGRGRRNEVIISYLVNCGPAWGHGRDATG